LTADFQARAEAAATAARAAPTDVDVLLYAAEMFLRAGDIGRATAFARDAVAAAPGSFRAARTLSGFLDAGGARGEAIRWAEEAVRLEPLDPEIRLHFGSLLAASQRWQEAADHLAVHVCSPGARAQGWRLLSSVLHQAGDAERATEAARQAVSADPEAIEYRLHLASMLSARALFDASLDVLAEAPDDARVWRARACALAASDRLGEALEAARQAVHLAPGDPDCQADLDHVSGLCGLPLVTDPGQWTIEPRRRVVERPVRPFGSAIATRCRVAYAIMLRDIRTRFGHTRLGYLWAILEPISHLMTLGTVFFLLNTAPPPIGDNLFLFYISGLLPFLMFSHVSHEVMAASDSNTMLFMLPIVRRTDVMVAQALRQVATELCVELVIFGTAGLAGLQAMPADILTCIVALLALWLLAVGVGAINMVIVGLFPSYATFYEAVIRLLYFGSGIYYSPIAMPDWVRAYLTWNPVLQAIEYFRSGFFAQYQPHWLDVNYLLLWVLSSVGIGFAMERSLRGRMEVPT
jgi:ABC-type polysaccharide/polyol phosphate export permease/Tfp pilus assembly protein PilF